MTAAADHSPADDALRRLEAAAVGAADVHTISTRLAVAEEERSSAVGYLAAALDYAEKGPGPEPVGVGQFFVPMMEMGGRRYPPALDALSDEVVATWETAAADVKAALPRARLNDLCFEGGIGDRGRSARAAVESYLEAAAELVPHTSDSDDSVRNAATSTHLAALSRARLLARMIGDRELTARAIIEILNGARHYLSGKRADPSMAAVIAELLVAESSKVSEANQLLEDAKAQLADDLTALEHALRVQLRLSAVESNTRVRLQRDLVAAIAAQADRMDGFARAHHLERAIVAARDAGQRDLVDELTRRMQAIDPAELELAAHQIEFQVPRDEVERWIAGFLNQGSWQEALLRLVAGPPPSGLVDESRRQADEQAQAHPLLSLATRVRVGGDGLPRFTPADDDELRELQLTDLEMQRAHLFAIFLPELFDRVWEKWGPIGLDELTAFFAASPHLDDGLARALASDLRRLFTGDAEGAAYTGAAHIEALARVIVLATAQPAYRTQRPSTPGQYIGLGALIAALRGSGLDESWSRFLDGLLSSPMGLNFRNELLHGFELDPGESMAALLFVAIIYLARAVGVAPPEA
jgi:hypothetical protein